MGIKKILTTPLSFGSSTRLKWNEPFLYRIRLRRDLWLRLVIVAGAWGAAVGVLLALFSFNVNAPGPGLAIGLGAVFGLGPAAGVLFWRSRLVNGTVVIAKEHLQRTSTSWGVAWIQSNIWEYPWDSISRCVLVPAEALGTAFSVLIVEAGGGREIIGIPAKIDRKQVGQLLAESGVSLSSARGIPSEWARGISLTTGLIVPALGCVLLTAGSIVFGITRWKAPGDIADQTPEFPPGIVAQPMSDLPESPRLIGERDSGANSNANAEPEINDRDSEMPEMTAPGFNPPGFNPRGVNPPGFNPPGFNPPGFNPPGFGGQPSGQPSISRPPAAPLVGQTVGKPSELVGGSGGSPFMTVDPQQRPLIGLRYRMGAWAGKQRVGQLVPLFDNATAGNPDVITAKPGYAVGAIRVDAESLVDAVQLIFMKDNGNGTLDPADSYDGEWIGTPSGNAPAELSGDGRKIIGIHGRGAAVLDSVGIVAASGASD